MRSALKIIVVGVICLLGCNVLAGPFATQVVSYANLGDSPYDSPDVALGQPALTLYDSWGNETVGISMVYGAWTEDAVVSLKDGGHLAVKFDQPITNNPLNPYGLDFTVFGNSFFTGKSGWVDGSTDMAAYQINSSGAVFGQGTGMTVSVSQDGQTWHTFESPLAGIYWPTQAFSRWDIAAGAWDQTSVSDFTKPMNPNLMGEQFGNLTVAEALGLYEGSGGGRSFDIGALGLDWIQYVRVEGKGNVDAFAAVSPVPEPATIVILLIGGAGMLVSRRRK